MFICVNSDICFTNIYYTGILILIFLIYILLSYGGPGTQKVTKQFRLGWEEYLASSHNIIIGFADGRGGAGRGNRWLHANYRRLGTLEVEDAITAGRYAIGNVHQNSRIESCLRCM